MRKGYAVYYLHGDHLGSTSLTTNISGGIVAQSRYLPYGQERSAWGAAQTDFTFIPLWGTGRAPVYLYFRSKSKSKPLI
jgi:hypothetical protein